MGLRQTSKRQTKQNSPLRCPRFHATPPRADQPHQPLAVQQIALARGRARLAARVQLQRRPRAEGHRGRGVGACRDHEHGHLGQPKVACEEQLRLAARQQRPRVRLQSQADKRAARRAIELEAHREDT
eukprot:2350545-Prymnesium_polylepis.1